MGMTLQWARKIRLGAVIWTFVLGTVVAVGFNARGSGANEGVSRKRPTFTDVAPRSRFTYRSNNDFTGRKYFPQPMCGGTAILDFDGDGWMDIFFTNGAKLPELKKTDPGFFNCLLRNRGDGTFEDVSEKAGVVGAQMDFSYGVAAGD